MAPYSCFLFAGEHSGDLHASALMHAMRKVEPDIVFSGVGGPLMQRAGLSPLLPFEEFQLFGVMEILPRLPRLWKRFYFTVDWIMRNRPDSVILVDYPGWNLRLGAALRKAGYKGHITYYIAPTVWAWGKGRIAKLEQFADLLLLIFPFEETYFVNSPFSTCFVGHPLLDRIKQEPHQEEWQAACGIPKAVRSLALFPGSRRSEIDRLFPRILEVARQLREKDPELQVMISLADESLRAPIQNYLSQAKLQDDPFFVFVPSAFRYAMMRSADSALAKSGTVTLELALHQVPTAVVYDLSYANRWIARYIMRLKLPFYCIVNILAGKQIYPEWIQEPFKPSIVAQELEALQRQGPRRETIIQACHEIRKQLGHEEGKSTSECAAECILASVGRDHERRA